MAVRRPRRRRRKSSTLESPSILQPSTIICEPRMAKTWKRPRQTRKLNLYLPGPPPVLVLPGRQRFTQQHLPRSLSTSRMAPQQDHDDDIIPFSDSLYFSNDPGTHRLTGSQKRANQWRRWSEDIIPRMIVPYLSYIQETSSLRHANVPGELHQYKGVCEAGCKTRSLKVACVLFDGMFVIWLLVPYNCLMYIRLSLGGNHRHHMSLFPRPSSTSS